jgi:PHD/YefM family antitoxin component YafN of YafNO toxin-antitoxin module
VPVSLEQALPFQRLEILAQLGADGVQAHKERPSAVRAQHSKRDRRIQTYWLRKDSGLEAQMTVTTLTSREFNQDTSGAKKAGSQGPVFITDRGRPAHVLLTMEDYLRLIGGYMSLAEALAQPGADFDFTPPRVGTGIDLC